MAAARMTILGLMSGSSLDGIDLALVEYTLEADGEIDWNILQTHSGGYDPGLQKALAEASSLSGYDLRQLDSKLGLLFGEICGRWIDEWGIVPDYIATHGHTVFHAPKESFNKLSELLP